MKDREYESLLAGSIMGGSMTLVLLSAWGHDVWPMVILFCVQLASLLWFINIITDDKDSDK